MSGISGGIVLGDPVVEEEVVEILQWTGRHRRNVRH
jgi:hypothetical protein